MIGSKWVVRWTWVLYEYSYLACFPKTAANANFTFVSGAEVSDKPRSFSRSVRRHVYSAPRKTVDSGDDAKSAQGLVRDIWLH